MATFCTGLVFAYVTVVEKKLHILLVFSITTTTVPITPTKRTIINKMTNNTRKRKKEIENKNITKDKRRRSPQAPKCGYLPHGHAHRYTTEHKVPFGMGLISRGRRKSNRGNAGVLMISTGMSYSAALAAAARFVYLA